MIQYMRFFIGLTLFLLIACSKPADPGYWDWPRRCDLNNRIYTDVYTYNKYCNEEHAYEVDIGDFIMREWMSQPQISKNCKIDDVRLISVFSPKSATIDMQIFFDSIIYDVVGYVVVNGNYWIRRDSDHISTKYTCSNLLSPDIDSVFVESSCTDTLGLRSVIDVFVNFPDSLCEEQHNN